MNDPANVICLTVDEEWANPAVLGDLRALFDERGLRATFFCTQPGVEVAGHERALHPNFRRDGDAIRTLRKKTDVPMESWTDRFVYQHVVDLTRTFCPEAKGVRSHSLFYDSELLALYQRAGIEYDSSCSLPFEEGLRPVRKEFGILELPVYYIDHFDLKTQATDFILNRLRLDRPGLKVLDFHPNMVFINATRNEDYLESKPFYHDYDRLLEFRRPGRGVRTFFLELLDDLANRNLPTATLSEVNAIWREQEHAR